jgi:acetyl esterase/lipase
LSAFDIAHVAALEQALADSGFAVWSLEYRRVGDVGGGWPGTFTDVARGTDYLREIAERYRLDLGRVVASGHSAGGAFALWLAARAKIPAASELHSDAPLRIQSVVALAPAPDLEGLQARGVCGNVIGQLMGGSPAEVPERYAAASPMRLAPIGARQLLVIGAKDAAWGPVGRTYAARAREVHDDHVRIVELPESGHFEMINPATSSWPAVVAAIRAGFETASR